MSGPGKSAAGLAARAPGMGRGGDGPSRAQEARGAKCSDASTNIDVRGRIRHACCHPGCVREGCFGQGGDVLRAYAEASAGRDASRWLGRWWCREHVPPGFLPQAGGCPAPAAERREPVVEPPRRQVVRGQGALL